MNCPECLELLQSRLDGDVPKPEFGNEPEVGEALERHLSECPRCREQHALAQRLLEGLQQLPTERPPAHFARDLAAIVVRDRRHRREKLRRRVLVTMALAASVLLTLLGAYWWLPREQPEHPTPKTPLVKGNPAPQPPAPKHPEQEQTPKEQKKNQPRNALAALTDRVADTTRDHAQVVWVATNLDKVEALPGVNDIPMLDPSVREAGQEVSDGVRTVTRGARRAFDFFARELPMPEMAERKE